MTRCFNRAWDLHLGRSPICLSRLKSLLKRCGSILSLLARLFVTDCLETLEEIGDRTRKNGCRWGK